MGNGEIAKVEIDLLDPVQLAIAGFLARYSEPTRTGYVYDLRDFFRWCEAHGLHLFEVKRPHIEVWARDMETRLALSTVKRRISTVAGFYKFAVIDGYITLDPAAHVRRPTLDGESTTNGLDRMEMGGLLAVSAGGTIMEHALIVMLGMLGLRVGEACSVHIEDLGSERNHHTIRILGKGHKRATIPLPPPVFRAINAAIGDRKEGPVLLTKSGMPMTRGDAGRIVKRLCKKAGITKRISPHSLRHTYITAMLDAGVTLRDVQIAARHADPRTTTHYDRARNNLDRHGNYIVAAYLTGGA
jgi:integrase/recombinase XerD